MTDNHIYLYARNNKRYRYNISTQAFEYSEPASRTMINFICSKQWGQWQVINSYLSYALIESLKLELLARADTIYSL